MSRMRKLATVAAMLGGGGAAMWSRALLDTHPFWAGVVVTLGVGLGIAVCGVAALLDELTGARR